MFDTISDEKEDKIVFINSFGGSSGLGIIFIVIGLFILMRVLLNDLSEEGKFWSILCSVILFYMGALFLTSYHTITVDRKFKKITFQGDWKSFKYIPFSDIKEIKIGSEEGYWGINLITNQGSTEHIFCKSSEPDVRNVANKISNFIGKDVIL